MPTVRKNSFKNALQFVHFSDDFHRFPVDVMEDMAKAEFRICFGVQNLNEEQRSIILHTNNSSRRIRFHRYIEPSQNVDWKIMAIISLQMRNPGYKLFFESGFFEW